MPRILVVEDDPDLLYLYRTALTANSSTVIQAANARTALQLLTEQTLDVGIIDLNLPDAHGSTIIDFILEHKSLSLNTIVVNTATDKWIGSIQDKGVHHLLVKPIAMTSVVALMKALATIA